MSSSSTSFSENQRPYIGVGVLVWKDDYLLLGERIGLDGEAVWQFPGGHLEMGETVTECAQREVREETGLEIGRMKQAGYSDELFSTTDRHYMILYVSAAYASGKEEVIEPEKCQCWKWFHYNELPSPLFGPIINLLKQIPVLNVLQVGQDIPEGVHK